jgi:hypothetical protein
MTILETSLANRETMLARLRAEIVGPDPAGSKVALVDKQSMTWEEFRVARRQLNGEEIVWQDPPTKRFGAGILFPQGTDELLSEIAMDVGGDAPVDAKDLQPEGAMSDEELAQGDSGRRLASTAVSEDPDEQGVTLANAFRPSALGLSFLSDLSDDEGGYRIELINVGRVAADRTVVTPCGVYKHLAMILGAAVGKRGMPRKVWLRHPVVDANGSVPAVVVSAADLLESRTPIRRPIDAGGLRLEFVIVSRTWPGAPSENHRLVTASVVNTAKAQREELDSLSLFQAGLRVSSLSASSTIEPYPDYLAGEFRDDDPLADENVNRVLYRQSRTFAIGHGCGADWIHGRPERVSEVWTDVLPVFETPATSADLFVEGADGKTRSLRSSMRCLAGLDADDDGLADVRTLIDEYRRWILELGSLSSSISIENRPTAIGLIDRCRECADRIERGLQLLSEAGAEGDLVRAAFRLANQAMLIAQLRSRQPLRLPTRDAAHRLTWDKPIAQIDLSARNESQGYWRPFQIAFLLMSLPGIVEPSHPDRKTVDLIWFPTGGGKTEAYLGLTAFTVFFNALSRREVTGVDVLMRYTLRLLTAQQFQRAATLFCAMESLRRRDVGKLGSRPFRIGLWVGKSATPNRRADALEKLRALQRDPDVENPYVLLRCPWCASKFGPHEAAREEGKGGRGFGRPRSRARQSEVLGYSKELSSGVETVVFRCADEACEFGGLPGPARPPLPIVVIDEDLLAHPPNLMIGTVDKFAMLAWDPSARRIFGLNDAGKHEGIPPTLIIQDELHLISGPLGSMVGAYEAVVEALCIDPLGGGVLPKIVASTATISRAHEQVKALYARDSVALFPPAGLDAADSFFARQAVDPNGNPLPGRLYAGVLAPAHGSVQTSEARIFATLMQGAALLDGEPADIDPWWTLLVFFNSLRELGGALTLFSADTREYLRVMLARHGIDYTRIRQMFRVEELTSRIRGDHIPRLLEQLEVRLVRPEGKHDGHSQPVPVDACLASNIIEVGVDIPRLSLMAIVGQPKTTSQYIQVSSRVGRDSSRPGLVVVIYGQTKARDRSHYEKFRAYHQKLYAQVEPTSVTPFSPPAVDRALHGLVVALVRQLGKLDQEAAQPDPFPLKAGSALRKRVEDVIRERVVAIAAHETMSVMSKLQQRLDEWKAWSPLSYGKFNQPPEDAPLMHPAGSVERPEWNHRSWATMSSLRNVDASCEADVTDAYIPTPGASA